VLDVGAGSGVWGIALAEMSRWVRVRAVDWPRVLEITRQVAARHGVADHLTLMGGDFFEADFGGGHQIATLGHILHSEGPVRVGRLLRKTWEALAPGGVAAIQEFIPNDDRTGPTLPLLFAVNMLVNTEAGGAYTYGELRQWLEEAGYVRVRLLEVPAVSPLVLADKPS
jgi:2-polyprenyl-3-methyl-5-hydroxy-6-metoxy-1,4-benzoquinol methylase